jgi:hypothetical protein
VETICQGKYKGKEIVVDHLVLSGHEFENINIGDRVSVTVQVSDKVLARYDADGIRNSSDTVEMFYVGMEDIKRSHSGSNCYYTPR